MYLPNQLLRFFYLYTNLDYEFGDGYLLDCGHNAQLKKINDKVPCASAGGGHFLGDAAESCLQGRAQAAAGTSHKRVSPGCQSLCLA
jgi:hypothetical protein